MTEKPHFQAPEGAPKQIRKTTKMLAIEKRFGKPIDMLLSEMYGSGMSGSAIGDKLDVSHRSVYIWLRNCGIEVDGKTPEKVARRIVSIRDVYRTRKDEIVAKIHTTQSARKRSETQKERYKKDPEHRQYLVSALEKARAAQVANFAKRREEAFGENVERLSYMFNEQGLTVSEIGERTGYSDGAIRRFMGSENIQPPRKQSKTMRRYAEVMGLLWYNPQVLGELPEKQKHVIYERFLGPEESSIPTFDEVGKKLGVTKQRVQQLESKTLLKLRNSLTGDSTTS